MTHTSVCGSYMFSRRKCRDWSGVGCDSQSIPFLYAVPGTRSTIGELLYLPSSSKVSVVPCLGVLQLP